MTRRSGRERYVIQARTRHRILTEQRRIQRRVRTLFRGLHGTEHSARPLPRLSLERLMRMLTASIGISKSPSVSGAGGRAKSADYVQRGGGSIPFGTTSPYSDSLL